MTKALFYPVLVLFLSMLVLGCESSEFDGRGLGASGGYSCQPPQIMCGGACVDVTSNALHCGGCSNACPSGTSCAGGSCACQTGLSSCSSQCVHIESDAANCGSCGTICAADQVCSLSVCAAGCDQGLTQCGQSCVDINTNVLHCGGCNAACPGGRLCQNGSCACERSTDTDCSGVCVDMQTDPGNCGSCGNVCAGGAACMAGVCSGGGVGGANAGTNGASTNSGTSSSAFINEQGRVSADGNAFGIQGDWYAFGDGVTSDQTGNPYRDGAYCITGEAPGDEDFSAHWGAGIGLDLNNVGGEKLPFEFEGTLNGFKMTIAGSAPTTPRVYFVNSLENDVTPFIPVTFGESKTYWAAEARVPLEWAVDNAGQRVDNGMLYSIQILAPGAEAAGPIDLCITEFEPILDPNYAGPAVDDGPYINSDGFISASGNPFGIEGSVYAIGDGSSTSQSGNPYMDGKYCVAGEFSGAEADWGAGIAFDLNSPPGGNKGPYLYDGNIEGFRIGLSGDTPGSVRVQFIINEPQTGNQPFLEALLGTTLGYRIDWATVPSSWDVEDAGLAVGDSIYSVQVYLEGSLPGPFQVCVEEFSPVTASELEVSAKAAASGYNGARTVDAALLAREYQIWKSRHFRDCGDGTACIPRDEGDCISEGVAYGMLLAVGFDDQDAFDKLWAYYEAHKNANGVMDWQTNACGSSISNGSATDGELDAAMALIQAGCSWGGDYQSDATALITAIRNSEVTTCNNKTVLKPGDNFGGCDETNPSYFAPAYYKVFESMTGDATWGNLVNDGYTMLSALQSSMNGLVPDWSDADGNPQTGDRGNYGPDASRTPWRIATDYVWNNEPRAVTFLDNLSSYIDTNGGISSLFEPNSNYRGALAMSGWHQASSKAQEYTDAWLTTSVDDESYFPGTLRPIYLLLAAQQFPKGCN